MAPSLRAKLIVMDTGPLITLAAADSLDYLIYPGLPVYVPDAVVFEATRDADAIGSAAILDWLQKRSDDVRTLSTDVFMAYVRQAEARPTDGTGPRREKDLGERAAIEAIQDAVHLRENERALLMSEDDRALRRIVLAGSELLERLIPLTTRDFLDSLESARRIQSADEVYRRAQDAGRHASRLTLLDRQHRQAVDAVRTALKFRGGKNGTDR